MSAPEPPPATSAPAAPTPNAAPKPITPETAAAAAIEAAEAKAKAAIAADPRGTPGYKPKPPPEKLTGWRSAFEHTGIPRSVLTARPRLPSRNWCIFLGIVGGLTWLYKDDRRRADQIRDEYIAKVEHLGREATRTPLDIPRKVVVYGARWPEDDESDRALRYFRKYVKPYLVAAAIDYDQVHAPLYGSIARIVRANTVKKRREALGLQAPEDPTSIAEAQDPAGAARRAAEGGIVLCGRPALKEYLSGLRSGWTNGVDEWVWEKEVEKQIKDDGFFDEKPAEAVVEAAAAAGEVPVLEAAPAAVEEPAPAPKSRFGFLSRSAPAVPAPAADAAAGSSAIPAHLHTPPATMPPQAPILLVPFTQHLGFRQIPQHIYNFFTEAARTREGAEAAYALITSATRPMTEADAHFGEDTEKWYKKDYSKVPETNEKAKKVYYEELSKRLESARQFARGEREITEEEKKSDKPVTTEDDLRTERKRREMRWAGGLEGWEIVRPETPVAWDPLFNGWLRVFDVERANAPLRPSAETSSSSSSK